MNLSAESWLALTVLAIVMGLLLFVPAGTIHYWQAWAYLSIFFGAAAITTLYLIRHDPALLARRMTGGPTAEKRPTQKFIMLWTLLGFIGLLVVPALDRRLGWSSVPLYASALLYRFGTPLGLGSYWGLVPFAGILPFLIWRLFDEERFLVQNLPGYAEYRKNVRYRLIPRVW